MDEWQRALAEVRHREAEERFHDGPEPEAGTAGISSAELSEAKSDEPLADEWNTYRREIGRLLAEGHKGRHVLIKGHEVRGIYETWRAAREEGLGRYPSEPFFVHEIRAEEPLLRVRGLGFPCRS